MHFELARCDDGEIKRLRGPKKFINIIKDLASAKNRVYGGDINARDPAGVPNVSPNFCAPYGGPPSNKQNNPELRPFN